ncbi:MAG TPA: hypothetical protein VH330_01190 [Candidatus Udaeobacter sp.]|jgi:hypothetical protein
MKKPNIIAVFSALVCLALLSIAQATPAPETPDPASTCAFCTADGTRALFNATAGGGTANSAFGWWALFTNTDASFNTAVGAGALLSNNGSPNTAVGAVALFLNKIAGANNAFGSAALLNNDSSGNGFANFNNAFGRQALTANVDGGENNAFGDLALVNNISGEANSAFGDDALVNCTGDGNTAIGDEAGANLTTGNQNVYVGQGVSAGDPTEVRFIRIGDTGVTDFDCFIAGIFGREIDAGSATIVGIDANQKLGTVAVNANGSRVPFKPQAMLDESLKQQKRITELEGTVERLAAIVKEQAAQIQKVSAQIEMSKSAPRTVANK